MASGYIIVVTDIEKFFAGMDTSEEAVSRTLLENERPRLDIRHVFCDWLSKTNVSGSEFRDALRLFDEAATETIMLFVSTDLTKARFVEAVDSQAPHVVKFSVPFDFDAKRFLAHCRHSAS